MCGAAVALRDALPASIEALIRMPAPDLFDMGVGADLPLAARMRPTHLDDIVGQDHLLRADGALRQLVVAKRLPSLLLWGPPGVGKTTLARLLAAEVDAELVELSAVNAGVRDIRDQVDAARMRRQRGRRTVLFIDEVHRFNKGQQDALLPHVENGIVTLIGATTENPSFEVNGALLSRVKVYRLNALDEAALLRMLQRALQVMGRVASSIDAAAADLLVRAADGDGRRLLNILDGVLSTAGDRTIEVGAVEAALIAEPRRFDKRGDYFYDQISALHKAVRGSSPDAALYWLARMLDGGCDALYIARRVVRMASEDIGAADPRVLGWTLDAWDCIERLGAPEGHLALAQAVVQLACAPKSNAIYLAFEAARAAVASGASLEVPLHLRNAPTHLARALGHGAEYRYAHDEPDAFAAGESYVPEAIRDLVFYKPTTQGAELRIAERLSHLRKLDQASPRQRWPHRT